MMLAAALLVGGCGNGGSSGEKPAPEPAAPDSATAMPEELEPGAVEETPAEPHLPAAGPAAVPEIVEEAPGTTEAAPAEEPAAEPEAASAEPAPEQDLEPIAPPEPDASNEPGISDPGGKVSVAATQPGLTRVGPDKCKTCHKVQYESWLTTAHAKRTPPLDCEDCHGPGSEYKAMAVMKDPAKAVAAGLVDPQPEFCQRCHVTGFTDDYLQRAHAHKK